MPQTNSAGSHGCVEGDGASGVVDLPRDAWQHDVRDVSSIEFNHGYHEVVLVSCHRVFRVGNHAKPRGSLELVEEETNQSIRISINCAFERIGMVDAYVGTIRKEETRLRWRR